jgi:hypothetical protein
MTTKSPGETKGMRKTEVAATTPDSKEVEEAEGTEKAKEMMEADPKKKAKKTKMNATTRDKMTQTNKTKKATGPSKSQSRSTDITSHNR